MTYETVEAGLESVIQKLGSYSTTNVDRGQYRAAAAGVDRFIVLERGGPARREQLTMGSTPTVRNTWPVSVQLFMPFSDQSDALHTAVNDEVDTLIDQISRWPQLDGTSGVIDARVVVSDEPERWTIEGLGYWWRQVIRVEVDELVQITRQE